MAEPHDHPADPKRATTEAADTMFGDSLPELDAPAEAEGQEQGAAPTAARPAPPAGRNIEAMLNVDLRVQVILGHARMPISQLLKLSRGSVIELDRRIGEPVDVVINDRLVARGDLIKLEGDRIGVTLTEIVKDYVSDS
ncbi:MAG: FliM/FliN family flagellar motor switch protein [Paracoccaceae bacterium]|jgi:flagellar motor switch protein FliN/FliY|nr:FliM/FliN family flagellar motor switch protein [Paracoccaceae bacterium]